MIGLVSLLNFVGDFGSISAVVGLAGAGLAIALQDPIVSLVGWFLIIGKSGITVGDRVEINNVKGDVIDVGLLRTAVLEVGNWVSAEQATGRVFSSPIASSSRTISSITLPETRLSGTKFISPSLMKAIGKKLAKS